MAANAHVQARTDETVKEEAAAVLATMGLSLSDAVRLLPTRIAREKALPFSPLIPNAEPVAAMQEARSSKGARFKTVDALIADLRA
jgi:DNA-damage-inducible protein J